MFMPKIYVTWLWVLKGLNSSLVQSADELWPLAKYAQGYLLWDLKFTQLFYFQP